MAIPRSNVLRPPERDAPAPRPPARTQREVKRVEGEAITAHADQHESGGSDPLTPAGIGAALTNHDHGLVKHVLNASSAPTVNDDTTQGFSPGSLWVNLAGPAAYICTDATATAAVWTRIDASSGSGLNADTLWAALGDIVYGTGDDTAAILTGNTTTTKKFLTQTGDGAASASPAWGTIVSGDLPAATTAAQGAAELATAAETSAGTDTGRTVTPDGLAGSNFGRRNLQMAVFDWTTDNATGDGKFYLHIDDTLDGMNLVYVHAEVITAGTTGTEDIQIYNVTQAADMLSTKLTIDSGETGSDTAATPAVIDGANDDVAENDVLRVDIDAIHTTAAKGLILTLGFALP